jgi:hypothetical protein
MRLVDKSDLYWYQRVTQETRFGCWPLCCETSDETIGVCTSEDGQMQNHTSTGSATMAEVAFRNEQFEYIKKIRQQFISKGFPVLSMDTKKKELLGNFFRNGHLLTHEQINVFDHTSTGLSNRDFKSFSHGTVVPHGIYVPQCLLSHTWDKQ